MTIVAEHAILTEPTGPPLVTAVHMQTVIDRLSTQHATQCGRQDCPAIADLRITLPAGHIPATVYRCVLCWFQLRDILTGEDHDLKYDPRAAGVIQQVLMGEAEELSALT
jgi:hypothetical protein